MALLTCFTACKKDDGGPEPDPPEASEPGISFREFPNADATLQATYYSERADSGIIGMITYFQGVAKAAFRAADGSLTSPQKIVVEGTALKPKQGIYTNAPGTTAGIDFGSQVEWDITGRAAIPDFDENTPGPVPEIGDINVKDSILTNQTLKLIIDSQNPYTTLGQIDSIRYKLVGPERSLVRKTAALDSVIITSQELLSLGKGRAYVQAEAYRFYTKNFSGYEVVFVNQAVFNKAVWID